MRRRRVFVRIPATLLLLLLLAGCSGSNPTAAPASPAGGAAIPTGAGATRTGVTASSTALLGTPGVGSARFGGGDATVTVVGTAGAGSPTTPGPTVFIDTPRDGATVSGPGITVAFHATGIAIAPTDGTAPPGAAHYVVILDETFTPGQPIPSDATHIQTTNTTATLPNVSPGRHIIRVVLVSASNVPLTDPRAQSSVTVTVS